MKSLLVPTVLARPSQPVSLRDVPLSCLATKILCRVRKIGPVDRTGLPVRRRTFRRRVAAVVAEERDRRKD